MPHTELENRARAFSLNVSLEYQKYRQQYWLFMDRKLSIHIFLRKKMADPWFPPPNIEEVVQLHNVGWLCKVMKLAGWYLLKPICKSSLRMTNHYQLIQNLPFFSKMSFPWYFFADVHYSTIKQDDETWHYQFNTCHNINNHPRVHNIKTATHSSVYNCHSPRWIRTYHSQFTL